MPKSTLTPAVMNRPGSNRFIPLAYDEIGAEAHIMGEAYDSAELALAAAQTEISAIEAMPELDELAGALRAMLTAFYGSPTSWTPDQAEAIRLTKAALREDHWAD